MILVLDTLVWSGAIEQGTKGQDRLSIELQNREIVRSKSVGSEEPSGRQPLGPKGVYRHVHPCPMEQGT